MLNGATDGDGGKEWRIKCALILFLPVPDDFYKLVPAMSCRSMMGASVAVLSIVSDTSW